VKSWLAYAGTASVLVLVGGVLGSVLADGAAARAVWVAGGLALVVQTIAFAVLLRVRYKPQLFMMGLVSGMVLRMGLVGGVAIWVTRTAVLPPATLLVALVAFVFVLLLLEPLFLRKGTSTA
jgi:hypothetical protein